MNSDADLRILHLVHLFAVCKMVLIQFQFQCGAGLIQPRMLIPHSGSISHPQRTPVKLGT